MSDVDRTRMTVVQFTRFRPLDEHESDLLAIRRSSLERCRAEHPEFREALLVRLENGDWLDVALWEVQDAGGGTPPTPLVQARNDFFERIDDLLGEELGTLVADPEA
jgi:hypothetical protein